LRCNALNRVRCLRHHSVIGRCDKTGGRALNGIGVVALPGCSFPRQLQGIAIDHNQVVANTADSLTLINILRARDGRPLQYTSISRISDNVEARATGNLSGLVVISGSNAATVSPGVTGSLASNPNFDITIHDSQAFQRGILQPIDPETIKLYLRTGWRADLLTLLLVERIDFVLVDSSGDNTPASFAGRSVRPGDVITSLNNDPVVADSARQFGSFVRCFTLVPPLTAEAQGIDIGRSGTKDCNGQTFKTAGGGAVTARLDADVTTVDLADPGGVALRIDGSNACIMVRPVVTYRSLDGVLYSFTGCVRVSEDKGGTAPIHTLHARPGRKEDDEAFMTINKGRGGRFALSAELEGVAWHIPAASCCSHQIIALVEQLFNLNIAGSAAPLSTAVRVVN